MTRLIFTRSNENSEHLQLSLTPADIVHVDAYQGKSRIFLSAKPPVIALDSLDAIEEKLLKFQFLKINNSTIINLEHISHISFSKEAIITLSDNCQMVIDKNVAVLMKKHLHK